MNAVEDEAYRHYRETLFTDLKQNIKPVIISLTMLAEDYHKSSSSIAQSIEEYIKQVPSNLKLLGLYLMDSIMKNLKSTTNYTVIFERNIIKLFTSVFECVDEQDRKAMYKLRQTWNDVFPNRILYEIDLSIKRIDPAWPVTAVQPSLANNQDKQAPTVTSNPKDINKPVNSVSNINNNKTNSLVSNSKTNSAPSGGTPANIPANLNNQKTISSTSSVNINQEVKNPVKTNNSTHTSNTNDTDINKIRDPRLINRKIGQPQQQQQQSQPSQQQQQQTSPKTASDGNKQPSLAGVKRTSPNSNQNPSEIKKIKLLSTVKPIDDTKPSKPAGTNTGNESPLKQNQQFINKNPKPTPTQTSNSSQQQQQSQQAQPKKISPASQPQQAPTKPQAQNVSKPANKLADSEKSPKQQQ